MKIQKIKNVQVPIEVILGKTELSVMDISRIGDGSIIQLDSFAGEPIPLRAADEIIAYGEVVVIDEHFGIRVTRLIQDEE